MFYISIVSREEGGGWQDWFWGRGGEGEEEGETLIFFLGTFFDSKYQGSEWQNWKMGLLALMQPLYLSLCLVLLWTLSSEHRPHPSHLSFPWSSPTAQRAPLFLTCSWWETWSPPLGSLATSTPLPVLQSCSLKHLSCCQGPPSFPSPLSFSTHRQHSTCTFLLSTLLTQALLGPPFFSSHPPSPTVEGHLKLQSCTSSFPTKLIRYWHLNPACGSPCPLLDRPSVPSTHAYAVLLPPYLALVSDGAHPWNTRVGLLLWEFAHAGFSTWDAFPVYWNQLKSQLRGEAWPMYCSVLFPLKGRGLIPTCDRCVGLCFFIKAMGVLGKNRWERRKEFIHPLPPLLFANPFTHTSGDAAQSWGWCCPRLVGGFLPQWTQSRQSLADTPRYLSSSWY